MRMKAPKEGSCDPIAPLELPHSLHAFHRVSETDSLNMVTSSLLALCYFQDILLLLINQETRMLKKAQTQDYKDITVFLSLQSASDILS